MLWDFTPWRPSGWPAPPTAARAHRPSGRRRSGFHRSTEASGARKQRLAWPFALARDRRRSAVCRRGPPVPARGATFRRLRPVQGQRGDSRSGPDHRRRGAAFPRGETGSRGQEECRSGRHGPLLRQAAWARSRCGQANGRVDTRQPRPQRPTADSPTQVAPERAACSALAPPWPYLPRIQVSVICFAARKSRTEKKGRLTDPLVANICFVSDSNCLTAQSRFRLWPSPISLARSERALA